MRWEFERVAKVPAKPVSYATIKRSIDNSEEKK
jgi:hypothetical protein